MPRYELGIQTVAAATAAPYATLKGGGSIRGELRELHVTANAATLSSVGLGRPANTPTGTGPVSGIAVDSSADAASTVVAHSTWSTAPTAPTNFLRRFVIPAVAGAGFVWVWEKGLGPKLVLSAGTDQWLVLWNFGAGTGSILSATFVWDE